MFSLTQNSEHRTTQNVLLGKQEQLLHRREAILNPHPALGTRAQELILDLNPRHLRRRPRS